MWWILIVFVCTLFGKLAAQEEIIDSVYKQGIDLQTQLKDYRSPQKAALYSAVFPGLGQIYNKKYIKAGLAVGIITTGVVFTTYYQSQYNTFREAYINKINDSDYLYNGADISAESLANVMNETRRYRDYAVLITVLAYGLNILDATVDAHLHAVRKDPDLIISPTIIDPSLMKESAIGVGLNLNIKF